MRGLLKISVVISKCFSKNSRDSEVSCGGSMGAILMLVRCQSPREVFTGKIVLHVT